MKFLVRLFFRGLRIVLGPFLLLGEVLFRPKGMVRTPELQKQVDRACQALTLYQFRTCPFCIKVRQEVRRLSLNIAYLDAQRDEQNRSDLLQGGGQVKVPCLKIVDANGESEWLYESGRIIEYLRRHYAGASN